jgi:hypothetical protein
MVQHTSCLAINGGIDGSATGDAGLVRHSSLCVEGFMVTGVLMAPCTDTGNHRRSDSKKSSLHIEQVFPVQLW